MIKQAPLFIIAVATFNCLLSNAAEFACDPKRVTFEKVMGQNLLPEEYKATVEMVTVANISTFQCNELCKTDPHCTAYSIDFLQKQCHVTTTNRVDSFQSSKKFSADEFYFRKRCLKGPKCERHWTFVLMSGVRRKEKSQTERVVYNILTRDECQESCFVETSNNCRSAIYYPNSKICILDNKSLKTSPDDYITAESSSEEGLYMENTCVRVPKKCDFHKGFIEDALRTEKIHWNVDRKMCENLCLLEAQFLCTGFVHDPQIGKCELSSQPMAVKVSKVPTSIRQTVIRFRAKCADVVMKCDASSMTAIVNVDRNFRGRIYSLSHPYECYSKPSFAKQDEIFLTMPLWGKQCGTKELGNGTFSNSIVIQEHPHILRRTDKRIDVYCDYDVVKQTLRSGKRVLESDDVTEIQSVVTGVVPTPKIKLQIVNESGFEVSDVKLGENLKLQVNIMDESVYGIFGSGLVAKSGDSEELIPLIDENGCPVEPSVFPPLSVEAGQKSLSSSFQAFKFASDPLVKFELTVSYCLDQCLPVECEVDNQITNLNSYGKRRRRSVPQNVNKEFVTDVKMKKTLMVISDIVKSHKRHSYQKINQNTKSRIPIFDRGKNFKKPSEESFCVTKSMTYVLIAVTSVFQVIMIIGCILCVCFPKDSSDDCGSHSYSRASTPHDSISSRTKLFQSSLSRLRWRTQ